MSETTEKHPPPSNAKRVPESSPGAVEPATPFPISSPKSQVASILVLALLIEAITALFRFGFGLESTRDTAATVGRLTFGLRIHHGYIGLALAMVAWFSSRRTSDSPWPTRLFVIGVAMALSDFIHHFLVLWPITGSPQFDLWYGK